MNTHTDTHMSGWLAGWLALLLGLGLAFSYIILQRTEAQITGKANTGLWGLHECVCVHLLSLYAVLI